MIHHRRWLLPLCLGAILVANARVDAQRATASAPRPIVLRPARVFDGVGPTVREGVVVLVRGERIEAIGPASQVADGLHALREFMPVTDIISWGTPVGMDPADPGIRRSLERFAAEVMPQFRDV